MYEYRDALNHLEEIFGRYCTMDKVATEEKILLSQEEPKWLPLEEIKGIVESYMNSLPEELSDHVDLIYDLLFDAVNEAIARVR
jgi:hypothetical protein